MASSIRFLAVAALVVSCSPDFDLLQGGIVGGQADAGGEAMGGKAGMGGEAAGGKVGAGGAVGATVTFVDGQGVGAMAGPGWIALGAQDTLTSPVCTRVSGSSSCGSVAWTSPDSLCASGNIPMVVGGDYADNWGIEIGVDASKAPDTQIGTAYSTITVNFTGLPTTDLSIELHRSGDLPTTTYCHGSIASGTAYPLTSFNTQCYGAGGVQFAPTDNVKIDQVGLQVTSSTTSAFTLIDLCLDSIVFSL